MRFYLPGAWKAYKTGGDGGSPLSHDKFTWWMFIEDENGNPIPKERCSQLNKALARCLQEFYALPDIWGPPILTWDANATTKHVYHLRKVLYPMFPELRYCENNWKLEHYVIQYYPSWSRHHGPAKGLKALKKEAELKAESTEQADTDTTSGDETHRNTEVPQKRSSPAPPEGTVEEGTEVETAVSTPASKKLRFHDPTYVCALMYMILY